MEQNQRLSAIDFVVPALQGWVSLKKLIVSALEGIQLQCIEFYRVWNTVIPDYFFCPCQFDQEDDIIFEVQILSHAQ